MTLEKLQNESAQDHKFRLLVDMAKGDLDANWQQVDEALNLGMHKDSMRKGTIFLPEFHDYMVQKLSKDADEAIGNYKSTVELKADGSQVSDNLLKLSATEMKDEKLVLEAHGYNPDEWEIINAKNSMYNVNAKGGITKTLYSSKITVKKKVDGFNIDSLVEKLKKGIDISKLEYSKEDSENMLVIPFFDMHWGIANINTYTNTLYKTLNKIKSKTWDKILVVFGQDLLHNDGFTGQTTSGTMIDKVDMEQAWADAHTFYKYIFDEAILNSKSVDAIFSNGNHDQAMGWAFGKMLEVEYPQINFDCQMKQFKGYTWKNIFIGATHGDKGAARIFDVYLAEFGKQIANAKTKVILSGHVHHQKIIDKFGLVHKTLGTGVPTDGYHADNGFSGAQKLFQLLEYNSDNPEAEYFV